jgi:hypothetical protein
VVCETLFVTGSPGDTMMIVLCGTIQISVASPQIRRYVVKRSAVRGGNIASR